MGVELLLGVLSLGGCVGVGEVGCLVAWRRQRWVSLVWRRVGGSDVTLPFRRYMVAGWAGFRDEDERAVSDEMNLRLGWR